MSDKIRVLVVDDQELIRHGLTGMLRMESDIDVVGQTSDGAQAVQIARDLAPDVVLMDIKMPHMNGIDATRAITQASPQTRVVILTTYDADDMVFNAIRAGAQAYLLKESSEAEILQVVHLVHEGESLLSPAIAHKVMEAFREMQLPLPQQPGPDEPSLEALTEREASVLNLVANGKTNHEIAQVLYLTEGTVKNYVTRIMSKLHTNDRTQLAIKALRTGMAKLDPQ